jgi:DNA primase
VVCIMGTSLTEKQVGELAKLGKTVLLALDADSAGQEAMLKAARVAASSQLALRVVPLPKGLDPADVVQQQGVEAAKALVGQSVPFVRFQVERELERGDLGNAEGKDSVIAALRPVFATVPPSALREELLAHVADAVDLAPSLVSSWLPMPGEARGPGGGGLSRRTRSAGPDPMPLRPAAGAASPLARAEGDFLAQCLATPDAAAEILAGLDDETFSSDAMRRVVAHVRDHLTAPLEGVPEDDRMLAAAIAKLVHKASELSPSRAALQGQLANIELLRLRRQIEQAISSGAGGVTALRRRRDQLQERYDALIQQAMEETAPSG